MFSCVCQLKINEHDDDDNDDDMFWSVDMDGCVRPRLPSVVF